MTSPTVSADERFWVRVNKTEGCWLWTAGVYPDGYGRWVPPKALGLPRQVRAHRWAWELENGPVPEGLELDHLCRERLCVRPDHLEAVTHQENIQRGGGRTKLTKEQVAEIRAAREEAATELALQYGVSRRTIFHIWAGVTWLA